MASQIHKPNRKSRFKVDDTQYRDDPDYQQALLDLGNRVTSACTGSPKKGTVGHEKAYRPFLWRLITLPFTLMHYALLLGLALVKFLGFWLSATPLIWLFNIVFHTRIPGIELAVILLLQIPAGFPARHAGW